MYVLLVNAIQRYISLYPYREKWNMPTAYHKTHSNCILVHHLSITYNSLHLNAHLCNVTWRSYVHIVKLLGMGRLVVGAMALYKGLLAIAVSTGMFITDCSDRESAFIDCTVSIKGQVFSIHVSLYIISYTHKHTHKVS